LSGTPDADSLRKEYELSQEMHNYYGRLTWQIGAILLGGGVTALAIATSTANPIIVFLVDMVFTILVYSFYRLVGRYREISWVHLARCREIERTLGLQQHTYVEQAQTEAGVKIPGEPKTIRAPRKPSGWQTVEDLCIYLTFIAWAIVPILVILKILQLI